MWKGVAYIALTELKHEPHWRLLQRIYTLLELLEGIIIRTAEVRAEQLAGYRIADNNLLAWWHVRES